MRKRDFANIFNPLSLMNFLPLDAVYEVFNCAETKQNIEHLAVMNALLCEGKGIQKA